MGPSFEGVLEWGDNGLVKIPNQGLILGDLRIYFGKHEERALESD